MMKIEDAYPIIVTNKLTECRDFYTRWLGFQPGFIGKGMFLTLQVADAAAEFERLSSAGLPIAYPLRDEPWGQRRFGLLDPAGTWVDVVQHIEPQPGFWDPYIR